MKSLTKRNLLLVVLSLIVAVCSLTFAATVKPASAEETAVNNITVMEAASVRVGLKENEYSGIRFRVILDEATKNNIVDNDNVQLGFIITPKYYFDKALEAKATAEAEDGSYDFLTEMKKDNPENFAEDKKHAYVGIAGEGLLMENDDEATKIYQYKGEWVASAAVENIKEANRDLQFTMIAYLKTDSTIEYFLPEDTTFSRAYLQTAHKSVVGGSVSLDVISQSKDESIKTIGTEGNPAQVVDSADLYNISKSANEYGIDYAGTYFDLTANVEVNNDYVKIPSSFAGTFVENENSVKIINGGTALMSIFEDEENDGANVKCTHTLFTITDESVVERMGIDDRYSTTADGFFTYDEVAKIFPDATNSVGYSDNVLKWTVPSTKEWSYCRITPFFTKTELKALTQYNAVRFTYIASSALRSYSACASDGTPATILSMISAAGYGTNSFFDYGGHAAASNGTTSQIWTTQIIPMSIFLETYSTNTTVNAYIRPVTTVAGEFYLGDIELVEGAPTIYYDTTYAKLSLTKVSSVEKPTESETVENTYATNSSFTAYSSLPSSADCPERFEFVKIPTITFTQTTMHSVYAKLMYTADELEQMAGLVVDESGNPILDENDKKQYTNYQGIKLTYYVSTKSTQKLSSVVQGAITVTDYNQWKTDVFSIEEFIKFIGVKTVSVDEVEYTNEGLSWRNHSTTTASTYRSITADDETFNKLVFLGHFSCEGSTSKLYLAGIEFVQELPAA